MILGAAVALAVATSAAACGEDGPSGTYADFDPIVVDALAEAEIYNGGDRFEFIVDADGYVTAPALLPAGDVMVTLTYTGDSPAPHSLVFEGINDDQPIVAVDLPGSNNGTVTIPPGHHTFYDGAPGNREKGYEGEIRVAGEFDAASLLEPEAVLTWEATGLEFTSKPRVGAPADAPITLELTVTDGLPHSIALEQVRDGQPLVAVDGPGTNHRLLTLPPGTYVYFCAVPGHREAGMEGLITIR
jgi:hypothetical protein